MPQVAFGQALPPEWVYRFQWPNLLGSQATTHAAAFTTNTLHSPQPNTVIGGQTDNLSVTNAPYNWAVYNGRACAENASNPGGALFQLPWWLPAWSAAGLNPGAIVPPGSVVAVFDIGMALASAAFVFTADTSGMFWAMPVTAAGLAASSQDQTPGSAGPTAGFGIVVNDDGGGAAQYEFITWLGAVVLSRTVMPAGSVPDVRLWSSFRVVVITAAQGRAAQLYAYCNGVSWVNAMPFDNVTLYQPNTVVARALNYALLHVKRGSASQVYYTVDAKFGRSTPEGVSYQDI